MPNPCLATSSLVFVAGSGLDVLPKFRDFIKSSPEEAAAKEADLVACLRGLNDFLAAGGAYIGGERPCATDCAVMPRLYHMEVGSGGVGAREMGVGSGVCRCRCA